MKNFFRKIASFFFDKSGPVYDTNGTPYTTLQLDSLRGIHSGRSAEQSRFALELRNARLNKPVHETYIDGHISGAKPIVTDLTAHTGLEIKNILLEDGGSYYTGRVKTYNWSHKSIEYFKEINLNLKIKSIIKKNY